MEGRPWEAGDSAYHKGCRENQTRKLYLLVTLYYIVKERPVSIQGPCRQAS